MEILYQLAVSILVTFLLVCLFMFIIYKVRQARTNRDVRTAYYNSVSRIWLGLLILTFGLNTIVQFSTAIGYIVGLLFVVLGAFNVSHFNAAKKYFKGNLPMEEKAWEEFNKQSGK